MSDGVSQDESVSSVALDYRAVFESAPDGIVVVNDEGLEAAWTLRLKNIDWERQNEKEQQSELHEESHCVFSLFGIEMTPNDNRNQDWQANKKIQESIVFGHEVPRRDERRIIGEEEYQNASLGKRVIKDWLVKLV